MKKFTLCWECANATGGCCWSRRGEPVRGWSAIKTKVRMEHGIEAGSFIVEECPEFVRDAMNGGLNRPDRKN